MAPAFILKASDLARKGGFRDGELVDLMAEHFENTGALPGIEERIRALDAHPEELDEDGFPGHTGDHKVLIALVRKHLAPLLLCVDIIDFSSSHNPIRCGAEFTDHCTRSPVSVTLTSDELLQVLVELEGEPVSTPEM